MRKIKNTFSRTIVSTLLLVLAFAISSCSSNTTTDESTSPTLADICQKCGETKGTKECCNLEGKEKCSKCNLIKGSPGCCKLPHLETKHNHDHSDHQH